jgi:hypothetical protein
MADDETVIQPDPVPAEPVDEPILEETPLAPDTRPTKNVLAEIQRRDRDGQARLTKIERQQQEILAALQAMGQQRPPPPPPPPVAGSEYTDEQLGQLAAAGNAEAIRVLVERQTQRATQAQFSQFAQTQTVARALGELFTRYPMLRDEPTHPLTQAVYTARNQFLASGWTPGPQTDLEAIKAAIVNAPHLVPAPSGPGQETTRRAGVTAQQSMEGAAPRRSPQSGQTAVVKPLDTKVAGIAQRMNVKDPQGSLKRFMERQSGNRSTVSPTIQQAVREDGQA